MQACRTVQVPMQVGTGRPGRHRTLMPKSRILDVASGPACRSAPALSPTPLHPSRHWKDGWWSIKDGWVDAHTSERLWIPTFG